MADVGNNPDSKPRTLADSTNSDFSMEKSTNGDSYISNSGDMREFTNDPNYSSTDVNIDDFKIQAVIGRGSFGKVYVVIKKDNQQVYAMKTLKKDMILRKNQMQNTKVERMILERLNHPFIVKLHYAF
jgi:serine/threonine protein kinase